MDMLAEKIGMDPVEFRLKNFTDVSQSRRSPYCSAGLKDCLAEGAKKFGWKEARAGKKERQPHQTRIWHGGRPVDDGFRRTAIHGRGPDVFRRRRHD